MKILGKIYLILSIAIIFFIILFIFINYTFTVITDLKDLTVKTMKIKSVLTEDSYIVINTINNIKKSKGLKYISIDIKQKIESLETVYKNLNGDYNQINTILTAITDDTVFLTNNYKKERTVFIFLISIISIIIIFAVFFFMCQNLILRIQRAVKAMNKVAEKDITVRIDDNYKDEIGNLSRYINNILSLIEDFFSKVKTANTHVIELKDILSSETVESASSLNEISNNIESIKNEFFVLDNSIDLSAKSVIEINNKINNISEGINNQANAISQTDIFISEMSMLFKEVLNITTVKRKKAEILMKNVLSGGEDVRRTNEIVKLISDQINQILEIIEIINTIADKTNTLSINAAIESEQAGDKGRGFSVISDEIRKLAEISAEQSNLISNLLKDIIEKIKNAMSSSDTSFKSFNNINKEVGSFVNALTEITAKMNKLTSKSNYVTELTANVKDMTNGILNISNEMNNNTAHINESIDKLQNISLHVANGIKEIDIAIKEILLSTQHISKVSIESKERMEDLNHIINTFEVLHVYTTVDPKRAVMYFNAFTEDTKKQVEFTRIASIDMTKQLKEESKKPKASIWMGGSLFDFMDAQNNDLLMPYKPPKAKFLNNSFHFRDKDWHWYAQYLEIVSIVCNTKYFEENNLKYPESWQDLLNPEFKKKISIATPYSASTSFCFLITLIILLGEDNAFEYWKKFDKNVHHYNPNGSKCVEEVGLGEEVIVGISFSNDIMLKGINRGYPLKMIYPKEGTGYKASCIGMIKNCPEEEFGKMFINWCLSRKGQDMIQTIYGYPLDFEAEVANGFVNPSEINLVKFNNQWIFDNMERLNEKWKKEFEK